MRRATPDQIEAVYGIIRDHGPVDGTAIRERMGIDAGDWRVISSATRALHDSGRIRRVTSNARYSPVWRVSA